MTARFPADSVAFVARAAGERLLDLVFPGNIYCICCGRPIDERMPYSLCPSCVRILAWANRENCRKCGKPLGLMPESEFCEDCRKEERPFEQGFVCVRYGRMERDLIHDLKYNGKPYLAEPFGELLAERLAVEALAPDLIVPVPMYRPKERSRGYNQATLLAKAIARRSGTPCLPRLLLRTKDTTPMSRLSAEERRENARAVFGVRKDGATLLRGKTVLLVDDVFTTGSTAGSCAEALLSAGADRVYVAAFAAGTDLSARL